MSAHPSGRTRTGLSSPRRAQKQAIAPLSAAGCRLAIVSVSSKTGIVDTRSIFA